MWCSIMGRPAIGKRGLGRSRDRGRNRVPFDPPPTRITAFMGGVELAVPFGSEDMMRVGGEEEWEEREERGGRLEW